jgi:hypothetical protein
VTGGLASDGVTGVTVCAPAAAAVESPPPPHAARATIAAAITSQRPTTIMRNICVIQTPYRPTPLPKRVDHFEVAGMTATGAKDRTTGNPAILRSTSMLKTGGFASPSHDGLALDWRTIYQLGYVLHNLSLPRDTQA